MSTPTTRACAASASVRTYPRARPSRLRACSTAPSSRLTRSPSSRIRTSCGLFRGGGERRQFAHVARVVLNDDGGFEICRELFEAVDRSQAIRAAGVEPRHAVAIVVLVKMHEIAGDQHVACLFELDQQAVVARRVPG